MNMRFKIAFTKTNRNRLISCIIGLVLCSFIFIGIFLSECIQYNELPFFMIIPVLFFLFGIIVLLLGLRGYAIVINDKILINYGLSFVNKKIDFKSIIGIDYINDFKIVPIGHPAKGDITNTFKIKYNDAQYTKPQEIFISVKEHKEFLSLVTKNTGNTGGNTKEPSPVSPKN